MASYRPLKVALIRPPAALNVNALTRFSIPPLGLAYVAAAIQREGFQVRVVDAIGEAIQQYSRVTDASGNVSLRYGLRLEEILSRIDPAVDVIGMTIMFSREWLHCREILMAVRARFPNALIVVGGEHITACADYSMNDCPAIDVAVMGEGEETIVDVLNAHEERRSLETVPGITYRLGGVIRVNQRRARTARIDDIAPPAWELFPLEEYIKYACGMGFDLGRSVPIMASRGCPFQCTFCSSPQMWTTKWMARDPSLVLQEMQSYHERYGATNFDFADLTAIVKKDWIVEFCQKIIASGLKITWQLPSGTRSEALDEETLDLLYKSGCRSVVYAPESGSVAELKRIKKKVILPRMLESIAHARRKRIRTKANIIFGIPGSSWSDVFRTYYFLLQMAWVGMNDVGCFSFSPYPGSELFEQLYKENRVALNDKYFKDLNSFNNFICSHSYNPNFTPFQLSMINVVGMAIFYSSSLLFRPVRIFDFFSSIFRGEISSALARSLSNFRKRKMAHRLLEASNTGTIQLPVDPRYMTFDSVSPVEKERDQGSVYTNVN